MKKYFLPLVAAFLAIALTAQAITKSPDTTKPPGKSTPSVEVAQTISMITGVAISPLLGVGAVGAWKYFHAKTDEQRARLPWFAHPAFWIPALVLVALCFIKDTAGTALPTVLKKPLDVADTIEHKISGLVATGLFVPIVASIFQAFNSDAATLGSLGFATIEMSWLCNCLMVSASMAAFFTVCLASNAINILIILSPFTTVDVALKSFRLLLLTTVAASSWINPWMGAVWALIVIAISWLIAGWSFRLSHFGFVFIWDFVTLRRKRFVPDKTANKMFLGCNINKVPARTYGRLIRDEQTTLVLKFRPWLVLPARTLTLPPGKYAVGKGLFYSEIMKVEGDDARPALLLTPRYCSHEEKLAAIYGLSGVRDIGLLAAWKWLKEFMGFRMKSQPAA